MEMEEDKFKFSRDWGHVPFSCGVDVHKHELAVAIYARDDAGKEFRAQNVFRADPAGLDDLWRFAAKYHPVKFAMEATGVYHHVVADFLSARLQDCGWPAELLISNPADARSLPGRPKFDRVDALSLARYALAGMLKAGTLLVPALEDLKAIFRAAARLEVDRTRLKNRVKKTLDRAGVRPPKLNLDLNWSRAFLYYLTDYNGTVGECMAACLGQESPILRDRRALARNAAFFAPFASVTLSPTQAALARQDLVELDFKTSRKALLALQVDIVLATRPGLQQVAGNLATIPGFSPFSAAWLLAEVGAVQRYPTLRSFLCYCGCCPRVVSSAGKIYSAHVARRSNKFARTIFYNAALVVCNFTTRDSVLKRYAQRTVARKGASSRKLPFCVVAQKLARITYAILRDKVPFSPEEGGTPATLAQASGRGFTVADRRVLRRARNCLIHAGEILNAPLLRDDMERLVKALDVMLHGKS